MSTGNFFRVDGTEAQKIEIAEGIMIDQKKVKSFTVLPILAAEVLLLDIRFLMLVIVVIDRKSKIVDRCSEISSQSRYWILESGSVVV